MVSAGAFYFGYFAALGIFMPYWSAYLTARGFNAARIGELIAILFFVRIFVPLLWGYLGDRSGALVGWMRLSIIGGAVAFAGLYVADGFWQLAVVMLVYSAFWNGALPLFEARVLRDYGPRYAQVRLWGSLGFMVATLGGGYWLADHLSDLPTLMILAMGVAIVATLYLKESPMPTRPAVAVSLRTVMGRQDVITLYVAALLMVLSHGPYYGFFALYLQQYGYDLRWAGAWWTLAVAAEMLAFAVAPRLLGWFSLKALLQIAFLATALRWLLTATWATDSGGWLAVAQCGHALSYAVHHTATMGILRRHFGDAAQGRGQALYSSLCYGVGGGLGGLVSGYLWLWGGPTLALGAAAFVALTAWALVTTLLADDFVQNAAASP